MLFFAPSFLSLQLNALREKLEAFVSSDVGAAASPDPRRAAITKVGSPRLAALILPFSWELPSAHLASARTRAHPGLAPLPSPLLALSPASLLPSPPALHAQASEDPFDRHGSAAATEEPALPLQDELFEVQKVRRTAVA